jgi:carboxypeptidase Taq
MAGRTAEQAYEELSKHLKEVSLLRSTGELLGWDEQTYMPPEGGAHRAEQSALLAGLAHERAASPRLGELITELEHSPLVVEADSPAACNIREARRDYNKAVRLPRSLVEEISRTSSLAQQQWIEARKNSHFATFEPWLEKIIRLKRQEAAALAGPNEPPYDALLDQYEPGLTGDEVRGLFTPLREGLVKLLDRIRGAKTKTDPGLLARRFPIESQRQFCREVAEAVGFRFHAGRIDEAVHPFCTGVGPGDVRLTTRYSERDFAMGLYGVLHEAGHGMYEQGLDAASYGLPMGAPASLGVHESQSRLWENFVGRSKAFWKHFLPRATMAFPEALKGVDVDSMYAAVNHVEPSFIRVEADEVTYNLHILLRFELEDALIGGALSAAELPGEWNARFTKYFGITPSRDSDGCLQDIHWSIGLIGYFPTYSLGNMYAAQLYAAASDQLGSMDDLCAGGRFLALRNWLNEQVHRRGRQYPPEKLIEVVTGVKLSPEPLLNHLRAKFEPLYGLA